MSSRAPTPKRTTVEASTKTAGATTTEIQVAGEATTAASNPEAATTTTARAPTTKEAAQPAVATVSPRYQRVSNTIDYNNTIDYY